MEVRTSRTVLMRAKTYDDYTGLNWYDSLSTRRYLAASPRFQSLKEDLFDLNRPLAGDGGVTPETLAGQISSGDIGNVLKKLPADQQNKLTKTLADKTACKKLLETPQAQALIRKLSGK